MTDPLKRILLARVYDVASETPLQKTDIFGTKNNVQVFLKREDLQKVHSFKLRGAYNMMCNLSLKQRKAGVVTASAGNHAQGVALSAKLLNIPATIVMPVTTPAIKVEAVKKYPNVEIVLKGDNYSEAYEFSKHLINTSGKVFVHPFDDLDVIAGQGTIGKEIIEQLPDVTHVFVPVGGGGLLAGIAQYISAIKPNVKLIAVEPQDSNALQRSLQSKKRILLKDVGIFADGVAVKQIGKMPFDILKEIQPETITVNTDQICASIKELFNATRTIIEPAGALAAAGLCEYNLPPNSKAVIICSGSNVTFERLQQIAERTLIGSGNEALFAITMPEKPGALESFCREVMNGHSITEFSYRLHDRNGANILVGITIDGEKDKQKFIKNMKLKNYKHLDLSSDEIVKEHVRHMIGGAANSTDNELFYQIDFPERPGALISFLSALNNQSNISAFHYRNAASDIGKVLIGIETNNSRKLENNLTQTGYRWHGINDNTSVNLFLR